MFGFLALCGDYQFCIHHLHLFFFSLSSFALYSSSLIASCCPVFSFLCVLVMLYAFSSPPFLIAWCVPFLFSYRVKIFTLFALLILCTWMPVFLQVLVVICFIIIVYLDACVPLGAYRHLLHKIFTWMPVLLLVFIFIYLILMPSWMPSFLQFRVPCPLRYINSPPCSSGVLFFFYLLVFISFIPWLLFSVTSSPSILILYSFPFLPVPLLACVDHFSFLLLLPLIFLPFINRLVSLPGSLWHFSTPVSLPFLFFSLFVSVKFRSYLVYITDFYVLRKQALIYAWIDFFFHFPLLSFLLFFNATSFTFFAY